MLSVNNSVTELNKYHAFIFQPHFQSQSVSNLYIFIKET